MLSGIAGRAADALDKAWKVAARLRSVAKGQGIRKEPARLRQGHRDHGINVSPQKQYLYKWSSAEAYNVSMDVAVSELRAHLSEWLDRAREGDEVVITDRGVPIARLLGLTATATLERLVAAGVIARAATPPRPKAAGQARPRPRRPVADLVSDQRR